MTSWNVFIRWELGCKRCFSRFLLMFKSFFWYHVEVILQVISGSALYVPPHTKELMHWKNTKLEKNQSGRISREQHSVPPSLHRCFAFCTKEVRMFHNHVQCSHVMIKFSVSFVFSSAYQLNIYCLTLTVTVTVHQEKVSSTKSLHQYFWLHLLSSGFTVNSFGNYFHKSHWL